VTGGQAPAGAGRTDFAGLARAAGVRRVYQFDSVEGWRDGAAEAPSGPGAVVVWRKVQGRRGQGTPKAPRPVAGQVARRRRARAPTSRGCRAVLKTRPQAAGRFFKTALQPPPITTK